MIINISGRDMKVHDRLREEVEEKLAKFHRFFDDETNASVKLQPLKEDIKAEFTLKIDKHIYRAEGVAQDVKQALQQAVDVMERQIRKHKSKIKKQRRQTEHFDNYLEEIASPEQEEKIGQITRRKSFTIVPMSEDEATLQMEMLGHDFLLFLNAETGKVALIYRRKDEDYGLIEPKY